MIPGTLFDESRSDFNSDRASTPQGSTLSDGWHFLLASTFSTNQQQIFAKPHCRRRFSGLSPVKLNKCMISQGGEIVG